MGTSIWELKTKGGDASAKTLGGIAKEMLGLSKVTTAFKKAGGVAGVVGDPKEMEAAKKIQQQITEEINKRKKAYADLQQAIAVEADVTKWRKLKDEAAVYREGIRDLEGELKAVQKRMQGVKDDGKDMFDGGFGGGGNTAFAITGGARSVGQIVQGSSFDGPAAQIAAASNSVAEFADNAAQLRETFTSLTPVVVDTLRTFKPVGTGLQGVFAGVKTGASGVAASLGTLGVAAIGVTAALIVVGKVMESLGADAERARQSAQRYLDARRQQLDLEAELDEMIAAGDAEGVEARYQRALANNQRIDQLLADTQANIDAVDREYAALGQAFAPGNRNELGTLGQEYRDQLKTLQEEQAAALREWNDIAAARSAAAQAAREREEAERRADNLANAESELTQVRLQARDATDQFAKSLAEFRDNAAYEASQRSRERQRDDIRASRDHQAELARITTDGRKQVAGINRDYWKTLGDIAKDETKANAAALKQFGKANTQIELDYNKSYVEANERRTKDLLKQEKQYAKDLKRQQEDLHDSLFDAELDNNAVAFIQAKRDAEKQKRRDLEDRAEAAQEERDAFTEELAELRKQKDERIVELRQQFEEERSDRAEQLRERLADERASYIERLAEQRTSNAEALAEARASYQTQRRELTEQRQWEDQQTAEQNRRQLEQMQRANDEQLAELQNREADLLHVIESGGDWQIQEVSYQQLQLVETYRQGANQAVAAVRQAMSSFGSFGGTAAPTRRTALNTGLRGRSTLNMAFAGRPAVFADDGGIFEKPTLTLVAERRKEAIIPLSPSGGFANDVLQALSGAVGGMPQVSFGNLSVGDGVTEATLKYNLQLMAQTVVKALYDARSGTPYRG